MLRSTAEGSAMRHPVRWALRYWSTAKRLTGCSPELAEQLDRVGALAGRQRDAADSEGRDQLEQFAQLIRGSIIEAAIGTARSLGDLPKDALDRAAITLLEHEHGHVELTKLASEGHDLVRVLLE